MTEIIDPIAANLAQEQRADWQRRQAIQPSPGRWLEPTIGQRMRRMPSWEQAEVRALMKSLILRHAIRQTLYLHFHGLHELPRHTSIQRLRYHAREQESNERLRSEFNEQRTPFELHVINSEEKRHVGLILPPSARSDAQAS